ncbi:TRAP transporter fused permease subunit [Clostridium sp. AM58-1XD]|uniref:TRAP transporter permease n=1 Tax=Clostridium sp. AM58-1XD TaxID=2292307 RepID=UPI000E547F4A|nr:TRAP transporter fused permease subunit [Clostridium sp. AM58-1XD]RGY99079.1 C4-dicarboxylate ABC transporter [Clostridium sp. AM58-1XD]
MRKLSKAWRNFITIFSVLLVGFQIYTAGFGILDDALQRSIHLSFVLTLCFLLKPASKKQALDKVPIYDILFSMIAAAACIYVALMNKKLVWNPLVWMNPMDKFFAFALCILVLEAGRRTVGYVFIVMAAIFLGYGLFGPYFPGMWKHKGFTLDMIFQYFYHTTNGVWGTMTGLSANLLAMFGIFGSMLSETGGAETFIKIGQKAVGKTIGGAGKVALVGSGLFGMISGQPVANVLATGSFTVPMMERAGYSREWTASTVAIGSTGGQIMPPIMGAGAFIMAQIIGVKYSDIAKAAIFPAFLFYAGALIAIHYQSKRYGIRGSEAQVNEKISARQYVTIIAPIAIFLFFVINNYSTVLAACYASVIGFLLYLLCYVPWKEGAGAAVKVTGKSFLTICDESAKAMISMTCLMVSAQVVIVFINFSGFGLKLSDLIVSLGAGNLFICLIMAMIVCIILGMGLPATAAYVIGAAVLVPPLVQLGITVMAAHMFVFYYSALSNITPPVCSAVYVSSSLAKSNWFKTGILSCMIALPVFIIPFAFVYCNGLLLMAGSSAGNTIFAFVSASIGVYAVSIGVAGFKERTFSKWEQAVCILAGAVMVTPFVIPSVTAIVIFMVLLIYEKKTAGKRTEAVT